MHLTYRNVDAAFRGLVGGMAAGDLPTVREGSRAGDVVRVTCPVLVTYERPRERVLTSRARDANPFFHFYNALWMLAGRDDVMSLARYATKMADYSDDGKTLNGAYGYRWRNGDYDTEHLIQDNPLGRRTSYNEVQTKGLYINRDERGTLDQLSWIVDHLRANPTSRRAVLQMWNVEDDLLKIDISRDVCCLAPEVSFRSPEGDMSIRELAKRFQSDETYKYPVYSVDTITGDQRISWMTNAWKTGVKPVRRITFDDGSSIRLTNDHKVFRKKKLFDGKRCVGVKVDEVVVGDLSVGDRLLATLSEGASCRTNTAGYRLFKRNIYRNTNHDNMILEHREYISMFENLIEYEDGYSIHHRDGNKLNNKIENLEQLPNSEHFKIGKQGRDNPHYKMSGADKKARGRKHSASLKKAWASMTAELRSALITRKKNRTPEHWRLINEHNSSKSNHKIVSIEPAGIVPVYDFTVPGRHNAVLSNGVVVHNCNLSVMFSLREGKDRSSTRSAIDPILGPLPVADQYLDVTVTNRSNDLTWGLLGEDHVTFSMLQEYLAGRLGTEVGLYHHLTNNLHAYVDRWEPGKWLAEPERGYPGVGPVLGHGEAENERLAIRALDPEIAAFAEEFSREQDKFYWGRQDRFLAGTGTPMMVAHRHYKKGDLVRALDFAGRIESPDWRLACVEWLERRLERRGGVSG